MPDDTNEETTSTYLGDWTGNLGLDDLKGVDEYDSAYVTDEAWQIFQIGNEEYKISYPPKTPLFVLAGMRLVLMGTVEDNSNEEPAPVLDDTSEESIHDSEKLLDNPGLEEWVETDTATDQDPKPPATPHRKTAQELMKKIITRLTENWPFAVVDIELFAEGTRLIEAAIVNAIESEHDPWICPACIRYAARLLEEVE